MKRTRGSAVVCLLIAALAVLGLFGTPQAGASGQNAPSASQGRGDSWTQTKELARELVRFDGSTQSFNNPLTGAPYKVSVTVDHTRNLRGRERVGISWSGAQPSAGRSADPYGANGMTQEYPVVILQCRGQGAAVRPQTCWTSSVGQRSQVGVSQSAAVWREDRYAGPADKEVVSGASPMPSSQECPSIDHSGLLASHVTPFISATGKVYEACDSGHMPPEAAVDSAFPPADIAAFSDLDGRGSVQFEVRSDVENESLGCNQRTKCSIVVVPISGISCDQASAPSDRDLTPAEKACRRTGQFVPGSSNLLGAPDAAVSPALWWSSSNWRNRFVVPITFGPPPDVCDILDPRPPTGFYGSELLAQAALQWSPAYCLNKERFKFQLNQMPDRAGWQLMTGGGGAAALVSSAHEPGADPVGYAPTAVTGFAVGYVVDKPNNQGEYRELRLNARLLAKLMTLSYPGSTFGAQHPGLGDNPWGIMADPEFQKLNPKLSTQATEAGAALLSLSNSSDIVEQLTSYLATDKDAMAFIDGKPDPWGMRVNPSYKGIDLPVDEWPLLDDFVPSGSTQCQLANPSIYLNDIAAPVTTLRKIAEAVLDGWPNVQVRCDTDLSTNPPTFKRGRVDRQPYGFRFVLGVVSLGDAARYGLHTAALQTTPSSYVAPTDRSLAAAIELQHQQQKYGPFTLDQADVRKSRKAYPGTMVVYTAARLQNLAQADADKVAQFIRVSTTEGQRLGSGNGQLPHGYLPIRRSGATAKLFASAQQVAAAVAGQRGPGAGEADDGGVDAGPAPDGAGGSVIGGALGSGAGLPGAGVPGASAPAAGAGVAGDEVPPTAVAMPPTEPVSSGLAGGLIPLLILLGAIGTVVATALRIAGPTTELRP